MSATPIRDALTRLGEEGLVDIFPQHVTRVRSVDIASAREAHFLRLSVELEMVRMLSTAPNPVLSKMLLGLVAVRAAVPRVRPDLGFAFEQALRCVAGHVHACPADVGRHGILAQSPIWRGSGMTAGCPGKLQPPSNPSIGIVRLPCPARGTGSQVQWIVHMDPDHADAAVLTQGGECLQRCLGNAKF
ncbi:hypothetical protein [Massilia violaceinigra]|uniref:hypothetical protein n=1 Tax=Massilia violaceinigra TaxID=2045208 RepID=UPI0027D93C59|nr:hypothetical protein [Massilia violaceinigra]